MIDVAQVHALALPSLMETLGTKTHGLTQEEAEKRLKQYGPNQLPEARPTPLWLLFLRQFLSPLIYILLVAALFSLWMQEMSDAAFIAAVLLINAIIGTFQEYSAQKAVTALKHLVPIHTTVLRDQTPQVISAEELCPGDIVLLASGDKAPADIRLLESYALIMDESLLTGESMPVTKNANVVLEADASLAERGNMLFAGTLISKGRGRGVVVATGEKTQIGYIADITALGKQATPPLIRRIEQFTLRLTLIMVGIILLLVALTLLRGHHLLDMIPVAIALAVAAVPEGMPAAVTVALAVGMRRMARHHTIIRHMAAVETLGSCTFIASDKTGTLTINEMAVEWLALPDGSEFDVSDSTGEIPSAACTLCAAGMLANEACVSEKGYSGDKVDIALLKMAKQMGRQAEDTEIGRLPYESEHAFSASLRKTADGYALFVKGSWEALAPMCSRMQLQEGDAAFDAQRLETQLMELADDGYRVLAFAMKKFTTLPDQPDIGALLYNLTFIGFAGMIDPLRQEAQQAVQRCRSAGIRVGMVTGDHPATALAIARQLGIAAKGDQAVTGQALKKAGEKAGELIRNSTVFARIEPAQKRQIVDSLIEQGHCVAVTGDGVNDAPALKRAHVGIAMGRRGTDAARENVDMVLTDDNFASIVEGVRQGRIAYANIRKIIFHFISIGMAEILLFLLTIAAGLPLPLTTVQLLWLNLVTGGLQDLPLTLEQAEGDELQKPPRRVDEPILNRIMIERVALNAVLIAGFSFSAFAWMLNQGMEVEDARNIVLLLLVAFENIQALNSRSETRSVFRHSLLTNPLLALGVILAQTIHIAAMHLPMLQTMLHIQPVSVSVWVQTIAIALALLAANELYKWLRQ